LWKSGQFSGDCYWIKAEQVTKTPESGEYIKKGAFIIRGERNYFKDVPLGVAVGLELKGETRVIGGPVSAIRKHGDYILELTPGKFNQNDISKKIYRTYADELGDPRFVKQIASPDLVAMMIPAGESDLRNQKPGRKGQGTEPDGKEYGIREVEDRPEGSGDESEEEFGEESEDEFGEEFGEETGEETGEEVEEECGEEAEGSIEVEIEKETREESEEGSEEKIEMHGVKKV
ncbi:MAG: fibronectin-binding domain-containing protein, partial [Methanosarcina sp.]|nr:fibronectin-binding domain-containing protein [Methanosarcina sp.]